MKEKNQSKEKRVKSEYVDFTIIHDREFLPIDQSVTNISEKNTTQKKVVTSKSENQDFFEDKELLKDTSKSTHDLRQKASNPYKVMGITYTSNSQSYTSVYKKWTHCNISDNCFADE